MEFVIFLYCFYHTAQKIWKPRWGQAWVNEQDKDAPEQDEDAPQQDEDSPEQGEQDLEMQEEAAHGSDPKETELLEVKAVLYCLPLHYIVHFIPAVELPISKSTCLKGIDPKVILHIQPI